MAQCVKNLPAMQVQSIGQTDPLEEGMATRTSMHARRISWTEEPGGLQSIGSQRIGQDWSYWARACVYTHTHTHTHTHTRYTARAYTYTHTHSINKNKVTNGVLKAFPIIPPGHWVYTSLLWNLCLKPSPSLVVCIILMTVCTSPWSLLKFKFPEKYLHPV